MTPQSDPNISSIPSSKQKNIYFLLVLITGLLMYAPVMNVFGPLSPGDNGRDLYVSEQVLYGQKPYQDFSWAYGPLMPYYYAFFYKMLGVSMHSFVIGKVVGRLLTGIFFYMAASTILPRFTAYLATVWLWTNFMDFVHTGNHIGGVAMIMAAVFCTLAYLKTRRFLFLWCGLVVIVLISVIKINIGLTTFGAFLLSVWIINRTFPQAPSRERLFWTIACTAVPLSVIVIYGYFLMGLPISGHEIGQCLPLNSNYSKSPELLLAGLKELSRYVIYHATRLGWHAGFGILLLYSGWKCFVRLRKPTIGRLQRRDIILPVLVLAFFYLGSLHEFIIRGVWYQAIWVQPISILISFLLIHTAFESSPLRIRQAVICLIAFCIITAHIGFLLRKPTAIYLDWDRAGVYVHNRQTWITTVRETTDYLQGHLRPGELFLAIPHDPLYYFLTARPSPTRHLAFIQIVDVTTQQELEVINDLTHKNVNYILMSNRIASDEPGLGIFGIDSSPLLAKYIKENFKMVARFGDWQNPPAWSWNHGTMILKRVQP